MASLKGIARDERGVALMVVLLISVAVAAIAMTGAMITLNAVLIDRYRQHTVEVDDAAIAGLEEGRSMVNGDQGLFPTSGYSALESGAQVYNAFGQAIPNLQRTVYVGPTGSLSGQYGIFASVVSVVEDAAGNRAIRRLELLQESFAKYAYFSDEEPAGIDFGGGDQIYGPVHSNDRIRVHSSGATFWGLVTTAEDISGAGYPSAVFAKGYLEWVDPIPLPAVQQLLALQAQASAGGTSFVGDGAGTDGQATTRIEFAAFDLNGDGDRTDDDEGFIAVYTHPNATYVSADDNFNIQNSQNCGDWHGGAFITAGAHPNGHDGWAALQGGDPPGTNAVDCFLGGDPALTGGGFDAGANGGQWLQWGGAVDPRLTALVGARANYYYPITRGQNPNFKGVIYVDGKVAISGTVRGRVSVVSSNDIIIVDDVTYATDPGAGTCEDILGLIAVDEIIVSDNMINAPQDVGGGNVRTFDDTKDEFVHGVLLALDRFRVENHNAGSDQDEPCETQAWGRGCLYLTGGVIQRTRGAVGTTAGTGYMKRYSYDACGASNPPPYFPTTGHFVRNRVYELDPVTFDVADLFDELSSE